VTHKIRLDGQSLRFAAGHFATVDGELEPLHGHNYRLTVEIVGSLTDQSWVLDFGRGKRVVRAICDELDHKFLLQARSSLVQIDNDGVAWTVIFDERRYVMPVGDVVALPIDNTTAERLAEWFSGRIKDALVAAGHSNVLRLTVAVEEAPGQSAWFSLDLRDDTNSVVGL
jgi:6-pyruvoyltetrahydropterin/6-carboxytetrahydropterin synthase